MRDRNDLLETQSIEKNNKITELTLKSEQTWSYLLSTKERLQQGEDQRIIFETKSKEIEMNHKKEMQSLKREIEESKHSYSRLNDELTLYKHRLEEKTYMLQVQYSNYSKERAATGNTIIYKNIDD